MSVEGLERENGGESLFSNSQSDPYRQSFTKTTTRHDESRRPRMEFWGTLSPAPAALADQGYRFVLQTKMNRYPILVESALEQRAKSSEGKEVKVSGRFDFDTFSVEVELLQLMRERAQQPQSACLVS